MNGTSCSNADSDLISSTTGKYKIFQFLKRTLFFIILKKTCFENFRFREGGSGTIVAGSLNLTFFYIYINWIRVTNQVDSTNIAYASVVIVLLVIILLRFVWRNLFENVFLFVRCLFLFIVLLVVSVALSVVVYKRNERVRKAFTSIEARLKDLSKKEPMQSARDPSGPDSLRL